jgi:hypothetical protein
MILLSAKTMPQKNRSARQMQVAPELGIVSVDPDRYPSDHHDHAISHAN